MKKTFILFSLILLILLSLTYAQSRVDFSFQTIDGKVYKLSNFNGKVVLVNLFASYCPPCMIELKVLQKLHETCSVNGLQVVSLMVDLDGAPLLPRIIKSRSLTYPVGLANKAVFETFKDFSTTPTTYVFDQRGNLANKVVGYQSFEEWKKTLSSLVKCN
jgi:thiol-disulfide isomerase/thioredoxin